MICLHSWDKEILFRLITRLRLLSLFWYYFQNVSIAIPSGLLQVSFVIVDNLQEISNQTLNWIPGEDSSNLCLSVSLSLYIYSYFAYISFILCLYVYIYLTFYLYCIYIVIIFIYILFIQRWAEKFTMTSLNNGIWTLQHRWKKCVVQNEDYIEK